MASNFGYVAIVVAVRDFGKELLGSDEDIMQMYRILCYSDMCNVYSKKALLKLTENANGLYYSYSDWYVEEIAQDLTDLAQLRILDEQQYYLYMKGDGWLGSLVDSFGGYEDIAKEVEDSLTRIKSCVDSLEITVSPNITYEAEVKQEGE